MSVRVKLYNRDVNEEEVEQNKSNNDTSNTSNNNQQPADNNRNYVQEYALVNAKIAELERRFNAEKQPLLNQRTAIMQAAAKSGISLTNNNESASHKYNFSTKLYESIMTAGKTDELINIINTTFDALPDLSYYMDNKGTRSLAKRMLSFLNDQYWNDGQDHWSDVAEFVRSTISRANISLSTKEVKKFIDELSNQMNGNSMFVWIFGNKPVAPEAEEEPVEEVNPDTSYEGEITPDDEEELLGFAEPEEEEAPIGEYAEDEVLPEDAEVVSITPDDEEELLNYAIPTEDDYELNESKLFNVFNRNKQRYVPSLFSEPELPEEARDVLETMAKTVASDIVYDINENGEKFEDCVTSYIDLAGDKFWDALYNYIPQEEYEKYMYGRNGIHQLINKQLKNNTYNHKDISLQLQDVLNSWGDEIFDIFRTAIENYTANSEVLQESENTGISPIVRKRTIERLSFILGVVGKDEEIEGSAISSYLLNKKEKLALSTSIVDLLNNLRNDELQSSGYGNKWRSITPYISNLLAERYSELSEDDIYRFVKCLGEYMKYDERFSWIFGDVYRELEGEIRMEREISRKQTAREIAAARSIGGSGWRHCGYDDDTYIK